LAKDQIEAKKIAWPIKVAILYYYIFTLQHPEKIRPQAVSKIKDSLYIFNAGNRKVAISKLRLLILLSEILIM